MFVASGDTLQVDIIRGAFSLSYNKTNLMPMSNTISSIGDNEEVHLKHEVIYLCLQLFNKVTTIKTAANVLFDQEEEGNSSNLN
ncbi:unnamed protein product [Rotaria sp. Silwood2]|nr:unnamed protein product [Rotaria sp. Silwood2]CAF2744840.1 unnamed protein product [Rotaria sp. Silwood2]CAF4046152.1 unnamed protein product [Rotaria sp. Silwood2]CAF4165991.1 unnamed protein product [Rotaria sp. Silwood2]